MNTDVLVIGGGPCGSYAAMTAASLGSRVAVCEEHREVGVPKHCAGHISVSGFGRLNLAPPPESIENEIMGAHIYSPAGREFSLRLERPVTYVINRELFDRHLMETAKKSGVEYFFGTKVRSLSTQGNSGRCVVEHEGGADSFSSKMVIDAEGSSANLLRRADLPVPDPANMVSAAQVEADGAEIESDDMVEVYLTKKYAPGLFAWIIPKRDGTSKIGLATNTGNPSQKLKDFMKEHPVASKKLRSVALSKPSIHLIPLGGVMRKIHHPGLLVVGDAASQVKPTTGGGVIFGLTCARIAGEVAREAVSKGDFSERLLSSYHSRCEEAIGFDLSAMRKIRRRMDKMSDEKMDKIFGIWNKFGVTRALEKAGDLDYQGRSLLKVAGSPKALMGLAYSFLWALFP